jgi:hypothetical protein
MCALPSAGGAEGLRKQQEHYLQKEKAKTHSDEGSWRVMFIILFPDVDAAAIPTSCKSPW